MKSTLSLALCVSLASSAALTPRQSCSKVGVLISRGTFEMGDYGIVGGPYVAALQNVLPYGQVTYWGNNYDNSVAGYLSGGSQSGADAARKKAEDLVRQCPGIKLVWSGYSQGAQVTHKALGAASNAVKQATKAVVLFGDPNKGRSIPGISSSIIQTDCDPGDQICNGLPLISAAHLAYGNNANRQAAWTKEKLGAL